ncbi:MAG: SMP-30/gluconolactonase/LRE family protein [Pseudomonadota bacterium]
MSQRSAIRRIALVLGSLSVLLIAYLLLWPIPIRPVAWTPSPIPALTGVHAKNDDLRSAAPLTTVGKGPEDLVLGPDGHVYTGLEDGRIVRFRPDRPDEITTYVNTGGRPLGLKFANDGYLIVADGARGLLSVNKDRLVQTLTDSVGDSPLIFVNHLDIAADGTIWFSDSSQRFKGDALLDMMEGSATGRLLSYEPRTGMTKVHLDGLRFANGVSVGPDDEYVLVSETLEARIKRLWVKGPRRGESDTFVDQLPGYPDNISYNDDGLFWVALPMPRVKAWEDLASKPLVRAVLMRLPSVPAPSPDPVAWIVGLNANGEVVRSHQSWGGDYSLVTGVTEINGTLYLGSIYLEAIARLSVPERLVVGD